MKRTLSTVFWEHERLLDGVFCAAVTLSLMLHFFFPEAAVAAYALVALTVAGLLPVAASAVRGIRMHHVTVDLLASVALLISLLAQEWASAAFITLMIAIARLFHGFTEARARRVIERLLAFRPRTALVQQGSALVELPIDRIIPDMLVLVRSGDRVPVDGIAVTGQASVNESTLSGESEPVTKQPGDRVFSSTVAVSGSLTVRVDRAGEDTTLERIIRLVAEGSRAKSHIERVSDRFAAWYIGGAFATAIVLYAVTRDLRLVLAVLLVVCADDIAVANPLVFSVTVAKAAMRGIIINGGETVERLVRVRNIVTDKTGTLTKGVPVAEHILYFSNADSARILAAFGSAAVSSSHPSAQAVVRYLDEHHVRHDMPGESHELPGEGVIVTQGSGRIYMGKLRFLEEQGVPIADAVLKRYAEVIRLGKSVVLCADEREVLAMAVISDEIRPDAREAVALARREGIEHWIMLTGDHERAAWHAAREVGIHTFKAQVTPREKLDEIKRIRAAHGSVAMIGDGVNDAAALAAADVGIAMGRSGSDVAVEAADVTLMRDELIRIPEALALSRYAMRLVRRNFTLWVATNAAGLALVFGGVLGPSGAAAYNFATDLITIGNSLLVLAYTYRPEAKK